VSVQSLWPEVISFSACGPISFATSQEVVSHDGGLLLFAEVDNHLALTQSFAAVLDDPRDPGLCDHSVLDLVRQRVYGILADYEDQNDADTLVNDPIFKLILGRRPDGPRLASQPTLSRFENSINIPSLKHLGELFLTQFLDCFPTTPRRLTIDLDAVDAPAHGEQHLTFYHGYYEHNQYYPLLITNADTDLVVMASLRHGTAHGALGADDDLKYLVRRVRQRWPDVVLHVRGDSAFGIPLLCELCEHLDLFYTFGLRSNPVLQRCTAELVERAVATWQSKRTRAGQMGGVAQPVRLFDGFWYRAQSWSHPRWVVAKAEVNELGTDLRLVVTNRPGAELLPAATYDEYALRGESENRNKELKCGLHMDRLSDHRFRANYFRLYLHTLAMNLLVRMRRTVALPPQQRFTEVTPPVATATTVVFTEMESVTAVLMSASTAAFPTKETSSTAAVPLAVAANGSGISATVLTVRETAGVELTEVSKAVDTADVVAVEVTSTAVVAVEVTSTDAVGTMTVASTEVDSRAASSGETSTEGAPAAVHTETAVDGTTELVTAAVVMVAATATAITETVPTEALAAAARRSHFRDRRRRDVLGEGQPNTWRRLLIKAVAIVTVSRRGIVVRLAENWPHLDLFHQTLQRLIAALTPIAPAAN
jgi:hypothetical protein